MNITHIVCRFPPYHGGMGAVALHMVKGLSDRGHTVEVLTPLYGVSEEKNSEFAALTVEATRIAPSIQYGNAAYLPAIKKELDRADIVHLHYPFFGTANLVRRWKLQHPQKKFVVTYHMDTRADGWKGLFFSWYAAYWMPKILSQADAITVSSFAYAEASQAADHFFRHQPRWHELPFGVDIDRFHPRNRPDELFLQHGLNKDMPTILFVGGMDTAHAFKGIPVLLKALLVLQKQGVPFQAVFVGEGNLREGFRLTARGLGLSHAVRFVGRATEEALPLFYNMADVLVLPSTHQNEAFGMVLLEAFASGVPVIASDLPGVRTLALKAGVTFISGSHTDLADAIAEYLTDANPQDWRTKARSVAETEYQWPRVIDRLEEIYRGLF